MRLPIVLLTTSACIHRSTKSSDGVSWSFSLGETGYPCHGSDALEVIGNLHIRCPLVPRTRFPPSPTPQYVPSIVFHLPMSAAQKIPYSSVGVTAVSHVLFLAPDAP